MLFLRCTIVNHFSGYKERKGDSAQNGILIIGVKGNQMVKGQIVFVPGWAGACSCCTEGFICPTNQCGLSGDSERLRRGKFDIHIRNPSSVVKVQCDMVGCRI